MNTNAKRFYKYNWNDPKFCELSIEEKLLYKYFWENCDIGGIHQINLRLLNALLSTNLTFEDLSSFIDKIDEFEIIEGDKLWITNFIKFQQASTSEYLSKSPPHKSCVKALKNAKVFERAVLNDPMLFQKYIHDLPLAKGYSNSNSSSNSYKEGNSNSEQPSTLYHFLKEIVQEYFGSLDSNTEHDHVKQILKIFYQLKEDNVSNPLLTIEQSLIQLTNNFGRKSLTVELLEDYLSQG